ncbi:hypothetical protein [Allofournierella sp.]|uniref:hypothetical protein n=1 Tax=Allofournierella sp. TaxID=1940256 RepID=UPI00206A195A|nr:MAG TPA: Head Tail Connector Protein [Caudoviricetes sp.]
MLYCNYETYTAQGGRMTAQQYGVWGPRASRKIDELTLGRAPAHAQDCAEELADACAQLADLLLLQESRRQAGAGLLVASATTDGASETYLTGAQAARAVEQAAWDILAGALGGDPFGLLYRGI